MLRISVLNHPGRTSSIVALSLLAILGSSSAHAVEKVVYSFRGGNSDGSGGFGALISDQSGTLYGTTIAGGSGNGCDNEVEGCGTVFQLTPKGREKVLYSFQAGTDGAYPEGSLTIDAAGNLYGTTTEGGVSGHGTIFRVAPGGKETVLYSFTGGSDGDEPTASLTLDADGNLYGTTYNGGNKSGCDGHGCGVVFEINLSGQESVLYTFGGGSDGGQPSSGVIRDSDGNL
jgi:uncharacterized repeat protein (TIGR03803 family)